MNRSLAASTLSVVATLLLLPACGGDGGDELAAGEAATAVEPGTCLPDAEGFEKIRIGLRREEVERVVGCPGRVDAEDVEAKSLTLSWHDPKDPRRALRLLFSNGSLFQKDGMHLRNPRVPSTCVPTQAQFDGVPDNSTYEQARQLFGCDGELYGQTVYPGLRVTYYQWGEDTADQPVARLIYLGGALGSRRAERLKP